MDDYKFIMLGDDIYTNIGMNGQYYRGHFVERKKINGVEYFVFETEEYREDGISYEGEFLPLKKSIHKDYPFVVGIFKGDGGVCNPNCRYEDYIKILGEYIVDMNFDKLY